MPLLSTLYEDTLIDAPGAPYPLVLRELRLSLERFCKQSLAWRVPITPITVVDASPEVTVPGVNGGVDIALVLPVNSRLIKLRAVTYNSNPISPTSFAQMDMKYPSWRTRVTSTPMFIETPTGCTLVPTPSGDRDFSAQAVLCPDSVADSYDDSLENYRQAIICGAIATLLAMPERPWSNSGLAVYHAGRFADGVAEAKIAAEQDHQPKTRVTPYGGL